MHYRHANLPHHSTHQTPQHSFSPHPWPRMTFYYSPPPRGDPVRNRPPQLSRRSRAYTPHSHAHAHLSLRLPLHQQSKSKAQTHACCGSHFLDRLTRSQRHMCIRTHIFHHLLLSSPSFMEFSRPLFLSFSATNLFAKSALHRHAYSLQAFLSFLFFCPFFL
ncbi:hypothetical protein BDV95DRAFT_101367 [Massariosphaeria phaeospora]|uniref:Uncharacterized protein n=1 Tax=Massariosphaeria phaeospora TaxID=100035 RepID=A0A7C8I6K3_9PLEO|nr:hypothetical protein BDV95DRAFT_101367 [Massariosphaeria phaeospora]